MGARSYSKQHKNLDLSVEELSLPAIIRPLLYEDFKNTQIGGREKSQTAGKVRNAEMNLRETMERYPENRKMLNIRFTD